MKKIMMALAVAGIGLGLNAASVSWKYTGEAADAGYSVYLYTSAVAEKYDSFDLLVEDSFANASVVAKTSRGVTTYTIAANSVSDSNLGDTLYYVLVSGDTAKTYAYGSSDISSLTFDPGAQQTAPGTLALTKADFSKAGQIVPEPTSGLLMLLGMAGLALRRRRA